jgi:hypothetical protein
MIVRTPSHFARSARAVMRKRVLGATLALLLGAVAAQADEKNGPLPHPSVEPGVPTGIYAVVPVESVIAAQFPGGVETPDPSQTIRLVKEANAYLSGFYTDLLDNPAVSGLALQVHWDTLNPNPPSEPTAYFWDFVDDAFQSVVQWNAAHSRERPKTIQLIVTPGFNAPQWLLDELTSCDGLFATPPAIPPSSCGKATFTNSVEKADGDVLPLPWNETYQTSWASFLTALAARYNPGDWAGNPLVSIAVAGPTASSAEMLLPNGDNADQTQFGGAISPNGMWQQLIALAYGGSPDSAAYLGTDQAFIDAWNLAIDSYAGIFGGLTLIVTTGNGLPNLSTAGPFPDPTAPVDFAMDCQTVANMDCQAETTVVAHFADPAVGGANAKATQTSGLEASRVDLDLGIDGVKFLAQQTAGAAPILGGAQFNTRVSKFAAQEGCTAAFPPTAKDRPPGCTIAKWKSQKDVPVACIPTACLANGVTRASLLKHYSTFGQVPAQDIISPEQAAFNVLQDYFDGTAAAGDFGGESGSAPLNYLQIYYEDIQYATKNAKKPAAVLDNNGAAVFETLQNLLAQASTALTGIAEAP